MTEEVQYLIEQRAAIDAKIAEAQRTAKTAGIIRVKSLMADLGITLADLGGATAVKRAAKASNAPAAYVSKDGKTWSGKGRRPFWLHDAMKAGANLADFKIAA